jgi:cytochrome c biogenesis protein CcmG/thiol:disulfide interchange protein DsbE
MNIINKPKLRILIVMAAIILSGASLPAQESQVAPNFKLQDIYGNTVVLSNYKDKQTVLLLFWTTWCPFCRKQLKLVNEKYAELASDGTEVLAINIGEPVDRVADFVKSYNLTFRVLLDEHTNVAEAYELLGIPTYIIIDKKGYIRYKDYTFPAEKYKELILKK